MAGRGRSHRGPSDGFMDALVGAMLSEGVDLDDPSAINDWMQGFNNRSFDERAAILSDDQLDAMPLPPVVLPDEASARDSAARSPLLAGFRLLVDFVGEGRKLTQTGNLTLADARSLVSLLDTGDRIDAEIGDRAFKTRSAADLPVLAMTVRLATSARFVRVVKGRMVSTKAGRSLGGDPLADLGRLAEAIDDVGMVSARMAGGRFAWSTLAPFFDDLFVPFVSLLLTSDDVPFEAIVERAFESFEEEVEVDNPHWTPSFRESFVESQMRTAVSTLEAAGIVTWDSGLETTKLGAERRAGGTVCLTPAGRLTLHRHLVERHGVDLPVARPAQFTDLDFEAMIRACEALPADDVGQVMQEITSWANQRGEAALPELIDVARTTTDPAVRAMALSVIGEQRGPGAAPEVRGLLDTPACRAAALVWLVDHECEPPEILLDPDTDVFVDVLALLLVSRNPDDMIDVFEHVGNHDAQLALIREMWRLPSPAAGVVLAVIGRLHPAARVAKAARKASMQFASRQANLGR